MEVKHGKTKLALWMCGSALTAGLLFYAMVFVGVSEGVERILTWVMIIVMGGFFYTASMLPKGTFK